MTFPLSALPALSTSPTVCAAPDAPDAPDAGSGVGAGGGMSVGGLGGADSTDNTDGVERVDSAEGAMRFTAVLTRPAGQSDPLVPHLHALGIDTIDFPLIDISAVETPGALEALDAALRSIDRFSLVFFVSPNAIARAFARAAAIDVPLAARLSEPMADGQPVIAVVGPGSVQALAAVGVAPATHRIVAPHGAMEAQTQAHAASIRYDSEALLASMDAKWARSTWAAKQVLIIRGDGGREWFADAMRDAQAIVHAVAAYKRSVPAPHEGAWQRIESLLDTPVTPRPYAWVLSSSEGVRNLIAMASARFAPPRYRALLASPVIVPHARIAAAASAAGFDTISNPGAGDMSIVRAVRAASERMKKSKGNYPA